MTSFASLGLRAELTQALAAEGITDPFAIQEATIADALAGHDVCGKARTGSGKTLAFGLPLLQRVQPGAAPGRPRALVLVPTRELCNQVLDVLKPLGAAIGVKVAGFYGGTPLEKQISTLQKGVEVVVATPGRLIDLSERKAFDGGDVRTLVLDEADRMADMGFLPQVEWLIRQLKQRDQTLLFSATLDGDVDVLVQRYMDAPVRHEVVADETTEAEMEHVFLGVHQLDRVKVIATITKTTYKTIVFVRTKRGADRLVEQLVREGVKAAAIHGDLRQIQRERALKAFSDGKMPVLVATDVAARGIHVDDIDLVIHFDLPEDYKTYTHRSGRTARAGSQGVVATFVLWNQVREVEMLQKRLRLDEPIIDVLSNDPRLADLATIKTTPKPDKKSRVG